MTGSKTASAAPACARLAGKYLTFKLASEDYAFGVLKVQEIIRMTDITRVPRTPQFVRGVINLRGKVIPVFDLRLKFELDAQAATQKTCIIVVQVRRESGLATMGTIVDEVCEVLDVSAEEIDPPPTLGASVDTQFILGMAKAKGAVKILLDVDRILSESEISAVADAGRRHEEGQSNQ